MLTFEGYYHHWGTYGGKESWKSKFFLRRGWRSLSTIPRYLQEGLANPVLQLLRHICTILYPVEYQPGWHTASIELLACNIAPDNVAQGSMYRAYGDKIRLGIFVNIPPQVAASSGKRRCSSYWDSKTNRGNIL